MPQAEEKEEEKPRKREKRIGGSDGREHEPEPVGKKEEDGGQGRVYGGKERREERMHLDCSIE